MLSDDPIRSSQHVRRNCQPYLLGGLEIDHKVEFSWLLDWQVAWLGALENLAHKMAMRSGLSGATATIPFSWR
jgi:hypothetical protein